MSGGPGAAGAYQCEGYGLDWPHPLFAYQQAGIDNLGKDSSVLPRRRIVSPSGLVAPVASGPRQMPAASIIGAQRLGERMVTRHRILLSAFFEQPGRVHPAPRGRRCSARIDRRSRQRGRLAAWRYVEFFSATIRNPHTRRAYARACNRFSPGAKTVA